jgi:hypothetical protein
MTSGCKLGTERPAVRDSGGVTSGGEEEDKMRRRRRLECEGGEGVI